MCLAVTKARNLHSAMQVFTVPSIHALQYEEQQIWTKDQHGLPWQVTFFVIS